MGTTAPPSFHRSCRDFSAAAQSSSRCSCDDDEEGADDDEEEDDEEDDEDNDDDDDDDDDDEGEGEGAPPLPAPPPPHAVPPRPKEASWHTITTSAFFTCCSSFSERSIDVSSNLPVVTLKVVLSPSVAVVTVVPVAATSASTVGLLTDATSAFSSARSWSPSGTMRWGRPPTSIRTCIMPLHKEFRYFCSVEGA